MIRPANMRTTHGIFYQGGEDERRGGVLSVSAVQCVEDIHSDPLMVAASGAGMDAPEDIPTGSVKAFFNGRKAFGFCQRTTVRR